MNKPYNNNQSGQVLLILVMILTTILAVVFSISFTSQIETQTTKLETESKRSLAAAEAILEVSLKKPAGSYSIAGLGLTNLSDEGYDGSATVSNTTSLYRNVFTTPLLKKDEQYTFYTSDYPNLSSYFTGNINVYLDSESACPAVELTYIHNDNSLTRDLIDPCSQVNKNSNPGSYLGTIAPAADDKPNNITFAYKTSNPISVANIKMIMMRTLFNGTKLGIQEVNNNNLSSQGTITSAQAESSTHVTTTVNLFQSYPQIPSDFFVTSF